MKHQFLAFLTFPFLLIACASTHQGREARQISPQPSLPLIVSAVTIDGSPQDSFQLIEVTLENVSEDWVRIHQSEVVLGDPAATKLSVATGKDLSDWASAMASRQQVNQYNSELAQAGLIIVGVVLAAAGQRESSQTLTHLGAGAAGVGTVWAVADATTNSYEAAHKINKVPENHLYRPFSVPGKMFLRRWVLINKPVNKVISQLVVQLETVSGERNVYEIGL